MNKKKREERLHAPRKTIVATKPYAPASEQFRTIRTNIMYSSIDVPLNAVLFTSDMPGAGKSTVATNMAIAYAQAGKRTLLLDGDLRRPTSHYTFEVSNQTGLSTLMINDMDWRAVIKRTAFDQLDLITSGPVPPNPSELLSSKRMETMMQMLRDNYEMVIVDSPPLLSVTDAQILSKHTDGVILVTNVQDNNRDRILEAKELLNKAGANIVGIILNNRHPEHALEDTFYYNQSTEEYS
ncbi:CpsD/CapB family tyrosine-protein kinase [Salinicoccus sesuvii]|uniref:non-specific protein-tyrosine kinase n=1 Tax=Salinicoccus sesuvii TaxID=868281 RepID=A0ABV7N674_9STAP